MPHCEQWRAKIFIRFAPVALVLARGYWRENEAAGYIAANTWLLETSKKLRLGRTGLNVTCSDEELTDYCKVKAKNLHTEIYQLVTTLGHELAPKTIRARFELTGLRFPLDENFDTDELIAALARICDPKWLKSQLRVKRGRQLECFLRCNGQVYKGAQIYISDLSLRHRLDQKRSNRRLLESLEAENQEGQVFSLAELADISPSNPVIRRHELMVRLRGYEEFAKASDTAMIGILYTLTCPSRFHSHYQWGDKNSKYDGSSPLDAQSYLNDLWARVRAAYARAGIDCFGMRIVEPHHDGTPHWHLLLFLDARRSEAATAIFRQYAMEDSPDEPGAQKRRFTALEIDPAKGSAAGYLAKYVSKNIDGANVGSDHYGRDAIQSAIRIEAWASTWGVRQFQQIGGASITVYRELRRLKVDGVAPGLLKEITEAADCGDWARFCDLMGGMNCPRDERPLRPYMIQRDEKNRYGEAVKILKGIWHGPAYILTRIHNWIVRPVALGVEGANSGEDGLRPGAAESNAPPGACAPLDLCQ